VINAGIIPAPVIHFLTPYLKADGALLLGAGHHPAGWNALVPVSAEGAYFNSVQLQELFDVYHGRKYRNCAWDSIGKVLLAPQDAMELYLDMLCSGIDVEAIASKKFKVIADFCNGSGSRFAKTFASRLGIELIPVNDDESGILPHDPEPRPRSSAQVHSIMKPLKADVGFVFNTDMSRVAVVASSGETLSEEYTFPLVANHVLDSAPKGSKLVTNCCTTRTLDEIVKKHKGVLFKTKVGQAFVMDKMFETKAALAGDGSGSVALAGSAPGFDGFLAVALLLEAMALKNCSSAELAEDLPRYHIVKKKIHCPSAHAYSILRNIRNYYPDAEISEEDGFRFDWKDGWVHLRASVTEPVVRMMVEWKTKDEAEDRALHIRGGLERLVSG
jgi:phosphomannomutase